MGVRKGTVLINKNDIVGKKVGKLKVMNYVGHSYSMTEGGNRMRHFYLVKCDCGNYNMVQRGALKNGITLSCGCSKRGKRGKRNVSKNEK